MRKLQSCIVGCLILMLTSCDEIPLPEVERCTLLSNGGICTDKRLPPNEREYERSFEELRTYQCTNIDDFQALLDDIAEKRKELAKLRRKCGAVKAK